MPDRINLTEGEWIAAAVPTYCSGPGWRNAPVVLHIVGNTGGHREHYVQPDGQTPLMQQAFRVCAEAHALMLAEARTLAAKEKKRSGTK